MKFTFSAGAKPFDGYTIKRTIHRGGFGEVYYAITDGGKEVALKLLHDNMEVELRGVSQCLNLKHPHLVNIFDVKTDAQGDHWIVMEYVAGGTLADIIAKHPKGLPSAQVIDIFKQCSEGLAFLHDRGLVHRDLKPANIFSEDGTLKIGDVGLTKFISQTHRSAHTQSVGTVYYMAPEIAKGNYGKGIDIYAMGIIAYEMLTGQVPFDGESTGEILMKHLTEKPNLSRFDAPLAKVLGRALEKDERNRFDSIHDFQQAMTATLSGSPVSIEKATSSDKNSDDGVYFANHKTNIEDFNETRQQSFRTQSSINAEPPLITQDNFEAWWWIPALAGFSLLLTRSLFVTILFTGLITGSVYCFRKSFLLGKVFINPRPGPKPCAKNNVRSWNCSQALNSLRSGRLLTIDMFQGIALTPIMVAIFAGSILFLSKDFFSSAGLPQSLDLGHLSFFVASSTLLVWMLILLNRLFHSSLRRDSRSRLLNGVTGILCGATVFGMGEWFMVAYPQQQFPNRDSGLISAIGQHSLVEQKESLISVWNSEKWYLAVPSKSQINVKNDQADLLSNPVTASASIGSPAEIQPKIRTTSKTHWSPTLAGYALFFGLLFAMRSWWRLGAFDRQHRFRLSSVALTVLVAYIICCIFSFPAVWAMTWAATITAAIQLASPCRQSG